ncbi:MAG TPA: hypothetical protein QGH92_02675 [Candidatus Parcubacteria bacterium]|nr:hypothetical protein [Candidatus Parcubacteria bacterium]
MFKKFIFIIAIVVIFLPLFANAQETMGNVRSFYVESSYDLTQRDQITATLRKISPQLYYYIDDSWWDDLTTEEQDTVKRSFNSLTEEFESRIYPVLTQTFGKEWSPGIDNDTRITILIHPMQEYAGGYFNNGDEYPKSQVPDSNEREMIYLNSNLINSSLTKSFLAHEFVHLIIFNQKDREYDLAEEVWLNEARAEYAPTFLGYNKEYNSSNLQRRVRDFLDQPFDSLTEWRNNTHDYGVINLFTQYLVDHYGVKILVDSLKLKKVGIPSLNEALLKNGFNDDFSQIFTNWTIAVLVNDCDLAEKYCYYNENLQNFRITPLINYLPFIGESTLSVTNTTKDWAGNWHKFIGGNGTLEVEFQGNEEANFKVPYLLQDSSGEYSIGFLDLGEDNKANISISDFGEQNTSFTIIPLSQTKFSNFTEIEPSRSFFWSASTIEEGFIKPQPPIITKPISEMTVSELLAKIAEIQAMIVQLQVQLAALNNNPGQISCQAITDNLYYGLMSDNRVKCLQEFLVSQGSDIYPQGLTTGNFLSLTKTAVIKFQEKYAAEILTPLELEQGTGFVGISTRDKINELLSQ